MSTHPMLFLTVCVWKSVFPMLYFDCFLMYFLNCCACYQQQFRANTNSHFVKIY